jgi:hypothetical protein
MSKIDVARAINALVDAATASGKAMAYDTLKGNVSVWEQNEISENLRIAKLRLRDTIESECIAASTSGYDVAIETVAGGYCQDVKPAKDANEVISAITSEVTSEIICHEQAVRYEEVAFREKFAHTIKYDVSDPELEDRYKECAKELHKSRENVKNHIFSVVKRELNT